jgi:hypothetical protein
MPSEDTMNLVISLLVAVLFTFAGWVAQTPRGDFVITIDAPSHGRTRVECVEGCAALVGRRDIGLHREGGFHGFLKDDVAGSAPAQRGDFIINVEAPGGETTLECIEGCAALVGARDISTYRGEGRETTYTFSCGGSRCEATFHGFLKR